MEVLLNSQNKNVTLNAVHVAPEGTSCCNRLNTDLLIIYINNSRDIYALTECLQNALLKKVNRGLTPSVEYLANCSTMKKIVRMAAKMLSDQDHKTATKQEKEQAAREHAADIIECVEYLSKF